jgi:hypothetical protein
VRVIKAIKGAIGSRSTRIPIGIIHNNIISTLSNRDLTYIINIIAVISRISINVLTEWSIDPGKAAPSDILFL